MNEGKNRQWGLLLYVDRWVDPEITTDGLYSLTRHGDGGTRPEKYVSSHIPLSSSLTLLISYQLSAL
jgi:hypothetical protein